MKAHLLFSDRDFCIEKPLPWNHDALRRDLGLDDLFDAMSRDDGFLRATAEHSVFAMETSPALLRYRQDVLRDSLENAALVREIYVLVAETVEHERRDYWLFSKLPASLLRRSLDVLRMFAEALRRLRGLADEQGGAFRSEGFQQLFAMLRRELSDDYLTALRDHLGTLGFPTGILLSAGLGADGRGVDYMLHRDERAAWPWYRRVLTQGPPSHSFTIAPRDENGAKALTELGDRGIRRAADILAETVDHIRGFFILLKTELAFYIGALNLHETLQRRNAPVCFPEAFSAPERRTECRGLYDVGLRLRTGQPVTGNDLDARGKRLFVVTGANQGGKSTFLRSIGLAQMMMQCGLFVGADHFAANVCTQIATHQKREEDATMKSGKLDEELARASEMVDHLTPDALLLFNESFAATNEREGSEIAWQITTSLLEAKAKIFFVTHLYEFASRLSGSDDATFSFLRAERREDGKRSFQIQDGRPEPTSFGKDLYAEVFGSDGPSAGSLRESG